MFVSLTPKNIKANAPKSPNPIPIYLRQEILSFKKTTDNTNKITGTSVITTELLIGVERLNPLKNISMLIVIPNNPQAKKRSMSVF